MRTPNTIQQFKQVQFPPDQESPLLQYFDIILESSQLNEYEILELCKFVVAHAKINVIEEWLQEEKVNKIFLSSFFGSFGFNHLYLHLDITSLSLSLCLCF